MPEPTVRFAFERQLAQWAAEFSRGLTGRSTPFFVGFRSDGSVRRVYLSPPGQPLDAERKTTLADSYGSWFLFAPYPDSDGVYLEWLRLPRRQAEVWLGRPLGPEDLRDAESGLDGWPEGWRVIVG